MWLHSGHGVQRDIAVLLARKEGFMCGGITWWRGPTWGKARCAEEWERARRLISPGPAVRTPRARLSGQPHPDLAQPLSSPRAHGPDIDAMRYCLCHHRRQSQVADQQGRPMTTSEICATIPGLMPREHRRPAQLASPPYKLPIGSNKAVWPYNL